MTTFFDLFAGIGGFRFGLERIGWTCVGWCEWDKYCQQSYRANFDTNGEWFWEDATTLPVEKMPDFDVLCGGFPCQPFSMAGVRKGFEDSRGTLVYNIFRILKGKQPKAFVLENVKGLTVQTFHTEFKFIIEALHDLGYTVRWKILNSKDFGVPQHRERIFIVGLRNDIALESGSPLAREFVYPEPRILTVRLKDFLDRDVPDKYKVSAKALSYIKTRKKGDREILALPVSISGNDPKHLSRNEHKALDPEGISHTVVGGSGGNVMPKILLEGNIFPSGHKAGDVVDPEGLSPTIVSGGPRPSADSGTPKIIVEGNVYENEHGTGNVFNPEGIAPTLRVGTSGRAEQRKVGDGHAPFIVEMGFNQHNQVAQDISPSLTEGMGKGGGNVPLVHVGNLDGKNRPGKRVYGEEGVAPTLVSKVGDESAGSRLIEVSEVGEVKNVAVTRFTYDKSKNELAENDTGVSPTLLAGDGRGGKNVPVVVENPKPIAESEYHFGKTLYNPEGLSPTVRHNHGDVVTVGEPQPQPGYRRIRRLTPRECLRLQGFPESFKMVVSDTQIYKQAGNAVTVNVVEALGRQLAKRLNVIQ